MYTANGVLLERSPLVTGFACDFSFLYKTEKSSPLAVSYTSLGELFEDSAEPLRASHENNN